MGFSRVWLTMAEKEIKVQVFRMVFPMNQRAKNDRSVRRALPVYDNAVPCGTPEMTSASVDMEPSSSTYCFL